MGPFPVYTLEVQIFDDGSFLGRLKNEEGETFREASGLDMNTCLNRLVDGWPTAELGPHPFGWNVANMKTKGGD